MFSRSSSKTTIVGVVANEPELRYTATGTAVVQVSVPANYSIKKGDEWETQTTWHRVSFFGKTAEYIAKSVPKRSMVLIEARLQPEINIWTDSEGKAKASYDFFGDNITMLKPAEDSPKADKPEAEKPDLGEIPF